MVEITLPSYRYRTEYNVGLGLVVRPTKIEPWFVVKKVCVMYSWCGHANLNFDVLTDLLFLSLRSLVNYHPFSINPNMQGVSVSERKRSILNKICWYVDYACLSSRRCSEASRSFLHHYYCLSDTVSKILYKTCQIMYLR